MQVTLSRKVLQSMVLTSAYDPMVLDKDEGAVLH
ncbi:hypothetical protein KIPB_011268, partial [Kipferlia bialata]|eukprot:g11268.t1